MQTTVPGPTYESLEEFAVEQNTTPQDIAELAVSMLCRFEELREFAAELITGNGRA